ncbi:MAG: hypothetical protein IJK85_04165 [Bacteroidales bacterium]|nr:hypothetical protein [Bacteroidales bacterium]
MVYTNPNKEQLPTITEVMAMVLDLTSRMPVRHRMPFELVVMSPPLRKRC